MSMAMPVVPAGSGKHPINLVVITANNLAASTSFYASLFAWHMQPMSEEVTAVMAPGGTPAALRSNLPDGFPACVPFIHVPSIESALERVLAAGGTIEKAIWAAPMIGKLARFKDSSGTVYGLTEAVAPGEMAHVPMPMGTNPKPPAGSICSLEMYASDASAASRFFEDVFGWGTKQTMPQYLAFDPGAGIGGVFQSHTSATPAVAYIYVLDVGETLKKIEASGGKRLGDPMPVPGMACFGYFTDPSGTNMGLIGP